MHFSAIDVIVYLETINNQKKKNKISLQILLVTVATVFCSRQVQQGNDI